MNPARIIDLWYEPGTAADAAAAAHHACGRRKHFTADSIRAIWARAQKDGRLPPTIVRPPNGFKANQADILRRFMTIEREKAA